MRVRTNTQIGSDGGPEIMSHKIGQSGSDRRLRPPELPEWVIARPRLDQLFAECFERFDIIEVVASAGSGKTVAAQSFASASGRRTAWLNLDAADRSTSRLIVNIAQSLHQVDPRATDIVDGALRTGVAPVEVAAALADNLSIDNLLLIFDNCEEMDDDPSVIAVITALLTYLPTSSRVVLLSRQTLDSLLARIGLEGRVARISGADLAFDSGEAGRLVKATGHAEVDVSAMLDFTSGWAAGMIFATPVADHGTPGDLAGYLNSQLLGRLPEDEQDFLLRTSLLPALTSANVEQLCGPQGPALLRQISRRRLLSITEADGSIVHHACFRQFLNDQLHERLPGELIELQRKQAKLLAAEGEYEAAVTTLLRLGLLHDAAEVAERALPLLYDRSDWSFLLEWLDQLGADLVAAHPLLVGALIRALTHERRLPEVQSLIRRLDQSGELRAVADLDPGVVAQIGWAFLWRPIEALEITERYSCDHRAEAVRYTLRVTSGSEPAAPPPGTDFAEVNRILTWGMFLQGRLDLVAERYPSPGSEDWPPRGFYRTPQPLLSLIWRGELEPVRQVWDEIPLALRQPTDPDMSHNLEAWILLAEGNAEAAVRAGSVSVGLSQQTRFGWEPYLQLVIVQALIRLGRLSDARTLLSDIRSRAAAADQKAYLEWAQAYDGLAQLLSREHESARALLRECVQSMRHGGRNVILPGALAYLSEAEARCGDLDRANEAAREAVRAAREHGCIFPLQQAVIDLPGILDRAPGIKPTVGVKRPRGTSAAARSTTTHHIEVLPFGHRPDICVDGKSCGVRRLKVIELAAYLALHRGTVTRHQAQLDLFPEHNQKAGSNYFRQIAHQFGRATGVPLMRKDGDWIVLAHGATLTSVDSVLEAIAHRDPSIADPLAEFTSIAEFSEGAYLDASQLPWTDRRRFEIDVLRAKVLEDSAALALEGGDADLAERIAERALNDNPFCEWAFISLDKIASESRLPERRAVVYRRAAAALAELDMRPEDIGLRPPRVRGQAGGTSSART